MSEPTPDALVADLLSSLYDLADAIEEAGRCYPEMLEVSQKAQTSILQLEISIRLLNFELMSLDGLRRS